MTAWIEERMQEYLQWLKADYIAKPLQDSEWSLIVTPFLGLHNDHIEIFAKQEARGRIKLSDDGRTLWELEAIGVNVERAGTRKQQFQGVLRKWGVQREGGELVKLAPENKFAQAKHDFLQCLQELSEFHLLAKNNVQSMFKEDLEAYLNNLHDVLAPAKDVSFAGANLNYTFDFLFTSKYEEKIINAFSSIDKQRLTSFLYEFEDARTVRAQSDYKPLTASIAINDTTHAPKPELLTEAEANGVDVAKWSQRDEQATQQKCLPRLEPN